MCYSESDNILSDNNEGASVLIPRDLGWCGLRSVCRIRGMWHPSSYGHCIPFDISMSEEEYVVSKQMSVKVDCAGRTYSWPCRSIICSFWSRTKEC